MNKRNIRNTIINKRDNLTKVEVYKKSKAIFLKLKNLNEYKNNNIILCYSNFLNEVQTNEIIDDALLNNKIVALPKVENDLQMSFHAIKSFNDLKPGYKGILEPINNKIDSSLIKDAVVIVPGTVFNKDGYRMGYGKGYYDRFIHKYNPKIRIGLAYDFQISNEIIVNKHDQKMDIVITENDIYR